MSLPRMSWHIGDYKRDTGHLRTVEHGAYFLLIMHYWARGALPNDDGQLARIACMTDREWKSVRPTLAGLFQPGWRHGRVDVELAAAQTKYERLSAAGKKGGRPRNEKPSESQAFETLKPQQSEAESDREANAKQPITDNPKEEEQKEAIGSEVEPIRARLRYPAAFEGWWLAYPRTPVMSKKEAIAAWQRLSEPDRLAAVAALPKYREWLKAHPDHPTVHPCRFLSQRRFDGFGEAPQPTATAPVGFYAADESPELDAWDQHYRSTKGINAPRDNHFGWRFPTQWPPGHEAKNGNGSRAHDGAQGGTQAGAAGISGGENPRQTSTSGPGTECPPAASARPSRAFAIE